MCLCMCVQLLPLVDLVRGIPCAVTKRRHLRKALLQYLDEFDSCKCAPCPNNARPVLSGTECKCVCETGTLGENCEERASDYDSGNKDCQMTAWLWSLELEKCCWVLNQRIFIIFRTRVGIYWYWGYRLTAGPGKTDSFSLSVCRMSEWFMSFERFWGKNISSALTM